MLLTRARREGEGQPDINKILLGLIHLPVPSTIIYSLYISVINIKHYKLNMHQLGF